jgi:phage shock protein A
MLGIKQIGFECLCIVTAILLCGEHAKGYVLVEDVPNLTNNAINEAKNYAQQVSQTANQVTQITNQITQIENQVIALERFGNPQYYVNMLGLSSFMSTASVLTSGIGQPISAYRQAANGALALRYTANGLYSNLTGSLDRYGNPVRYQTDAFRKFAAVNDMIEGYNTQQRTFNAQMASLEQQLTTAMQNLNRASTQMETEKYAAQVNAIHAQMNALSQTTNLTGQRAAVQQLSNANDAARVQEANREQEIQERQEDIENEAAGFARMIGGSP